MTKLKVHLIGAEHHSIHNYKASKSETAEKWIKGFRVLLKDAIEDNVDLEIIVIRGNSVIVKDPSEPLYIS